MAMEEVGDDREGDTGSGRGCTPVLTWREKETKPSLPLLLCLLPLLGGIVTESPFCTSPKG